MERIINSGNTGGERSYGHVPDDRWANYARKIFGEVTLYDTYQNLPLHIEEVKRTVEFAAEKVKAQPDLILDLGCGQNIHEISSINKAFGNAEIVATDIQPMFLETLMKRLQKSNNKAFDKTYPVIMDIGKQWPMSLSYGSEKTIKLDNIPLVMCNIVFNWLTKEEQAGVFRNVSERLSPNGDFILATLTDNWNSEEVKKHVPEQLLKNPVWTLLGAMGARRWADQTAQEFGIHRPSVADIYELAENSDLKIESVDEDRIFWKTKDGKPTAVVVHLKKK